MNKMQNKKIKLLSYLFIASVVNVGDAFQNRELLTVGVVRNCLVGRARRWILNHFNLLPSIGQDAGCGLVVSRCLIRSKDSRCEGRLTFTRRWLVSYS